jgi:formylglycine-generating enzyme required for sulfatase activity
MIIVNTQKGFMQRLIHLLVPEMLNISPGVFNMGGRAFSGEKPIHEVNIAYNFAIGKFPVTFEEYDSFCAATGRRKAEDQGWGRGRRPVINVTWQDAVDYCQWLSEQSGQTYRLPSEAEWEYACRAGSAGDYCFGDDVERLAEYAWHRDNSGGKTHPVGELKPNAWGLHDVHGNVWEWCQDSWHGNYQGAPVDGSAWQEAESGAYRVLRGGSWDCYPSSSRAADRDAAQIGKCYKYIGFRLTTKG